jgi:AbrB family looped-hinge helix DNA binding protein
VTTRVSSKGRIVLPAEIRSRDGIKPGQEFEIEYLAKGKYLLVRRSKRNNVGLIDWLLSCPEKGFFIPLKSEGTDTL